MFSALFISLSTTVHQHLFVFSLHFNLLSLAARQSLQDADLPQITSRDLDLLIEESDQFFGGVCLSRFSSGHSQGSLDMSAGHFSPAPATDELKVVHYCSPTLVNNHHRKKMKLNGQNESSCYQKATSHCKRSFCCPSHVLETGQQQSDLQAQ